MIRNSRKEDSFKFDVDLIAKGSLNFNLAFQGSTLSFDEDSLWVIKEVSVSGKLERATEDFFLEGKITLTASFNCARCLKQFEREMSLKVKAFFKKEIFPDEDSDNKDDTEAYQYHGKIVDIFPAIRDQIALSMPMKSLCINDCKGLCHICGIDLNREKCSCNVETIDPRFEALKKISSNVTKK